MLFKNLILSLGKVEKIIIGRLWHVLANKIPI